MNFVSTRGRAAPASLTDTLAAGMAADGGLFVPEVVPAIDATACDPAASLAAFAAAMLAPFFCDDPLEAELKTITAEALDIEVPLVALSGPADFALELFHGPTAAFKDFGARFLARCLARIPADTLRTVLVATSGDTGGAVAAAFEGMAGFRVVILYPRGGVSARQAHQLGAFGPNVHALSVDGSFDDCQWLVKQAFADTGLRERIPLLSANSISLGRLLPQATWFAHAGARFLGESGKVLSFAIPSGNLGHATAAALARAMGAPIARIGLATNANRTVPDWLADGELRPRASVATLANAMDVGNPSNAERLRWLHPDPGERATAFIVDSVDDPHIRERIRAGAEAGYVSCPHTACAFELVARRRAEGDTTPWCVAATAHPAKFDTVVEPLLGCTIELPAGLRASLSRPARAVRIGADYPVLCDYLTTVATSP